MARPPIAPTATPPVAQPTGVGAATEPPPDDEEQPNVAPEEQAMYERFIENFHEIVFGKTGRSPGPNGEPPIFDTIMETLQGVGKSGAENAHIEALATVTVRVVGFLADSAEQAGKPIPHDVLLHAASEIVPNLAEFAEALGIHDDYTEEELAYVLESASGMYAQELFQQGKINQQEMQQYADEMIAADEQGRIEEVLPGITEAANRYGAEIPQQQQQPAPQPQQGMGMAMRPRNG